MNEGSFEKRDETPTIEVRVWRAGALIHRELCESEEQAAFVVEAWSEQEGTECEVDDLTVHHRPGDIAEPQPGEVSEEEYAEALEPGAQEAQSHGYD
jgi:hypothetical protein